MSTHNKILFELLFCAEAWEPDARLLGNVRAKDIKPALRDAMSALAANEQLRSEVERLRAEIDWLTRKRDEARANSERLRERNRQAQNAVGSIVAALDGEL